MADASPRPGLGECLACHLPKLVVAPSFAAALVFVYGCIAWTAWMSLTNSSELPTFEFVGLIHYERLWALPRWHVALENLLVFGALFIAISLAVGILLAVVLDQRIRGEGAIRTIHLYPLALSFIVTGTAWKWMFDPDLGIQHVLGSLGVEGVHVHWLVDRDMAIYTIVIAAVWQSSGFVMAMFLAGLRSVDQEVIKAATMDGAGRSRIYWSIVLPSQRAVFLSSIIILTHAAIKTFDLVVALTGGGPGIATDMPATLMYAMAFERGDLGLASASAMMMLATVAAIIVPYLYSQLGHRHGR